MSQVAQIYMVTGATAPGMTNCKSTEHMHVLTRVHALTQ